MKTLYLHIGHGKTGTSWIQSVLRLSSKELKKYGILYAIGPDHNILDPNKITSGNAVSLLESKESFESILESCHPKDNNSLLFSSESLFGHFLKVNAQDFIDEAALKNGFERVEILLLIRNPISFVGSVWQQRIKRRGDHHISIENFKEYENDLRIDIFLLVEKILERLEMCKLVNLTVLNYSNCKDNLLNYLASWLKVPADILIVPSGKRVNRSMTYAELMLQKELNRTLGPSGHLISDPLCEKLTEIEPEIILPSLEVQEAIWSYLSETIKRINSRIPEEHRYHCDIRQPNPLPDTLIFSQTQIEVIAESLGNEILGLRNQIENAERKIATMKNENKELKTISENPFEGVGLITLIKQILKQVKIIDSKYSPNKSKRK
jgi:hypothetical protein